MTSIKLDSRLMTAASMVRKGSSVIDIGTDHGYLPCWLVQNKIAKKAIAGDVRPMPLQSAVNTIKLCGLEDKISAVLSDGLENIPENDGDTIILAGMGGILISDILSKKQWIKKDNIEIIAQPMTHCEKAREYFIENGFEIKEEKGCFSQGHYYCVIRAVYSGKVQIYEKGYIYYGKLKDNEDEFSKEYLKGQLNRLKKRYNALKENSLELKECEYLSEVIKDFERNTNLGVTAKM